ncbi:MAG: Sua5/YciO/YrdC/YwlC family protein, partial [Lachnospiraceae bacterium]|nr:Sua5/YciO/YrdC/YwlC family protein [Lachnospiraceae bacterium]
MKTKVIQIKEPYKACVTDSALQEAGMIIRNGGLVAFPTETVYGLGADALCAQASRKIYAAKGRPSDNPLIIHIAKWEDIYQIVEKISDEAKMLAN